MERISETTERFESRKQDHIRLSLQKSTEAVGQSGLDQIHLVHEALPDINFSDISLSTNSLNKVLETPFLVSSMTAGHVDSVDLNSRLARACEVRGWMMGVGSQRRELSDKEASKEWKQVRSQAPNTPLLANLGISQVIQASLDDVKRIIDGLKASALIVHLNPLQEVIQPEGTPNFKGGLAAIESLVQSLGIPVIVKETGCGFSTSTLKRLDNVGVAVVDVSGFGGTHWGRIEGLRNSSETRSRKISKTFSGWGNSTLSSLLNAEEANLKSEVWASGGIRDGLQAAKCLALGASIIGFAKPALQAALEGEDPLNSWMEQMEAELKTALFCTGALSPKEMSSKEVELWQS